MVAGQQADTRRRSATVAALAVITVGTLVCVLWALGIPEATRLAPESSAVRFSTGLCFVLGGASLLAAVGGHRLAALAAMFPMSLLAGSTLLGYVFGRTLGVDPLAIVERALPYPGVMAPNTAVALFVAAVGLGTLVPGHARIWALSMSAMLGALTAALGLVALLGYAFDFTAAFEWAGLTRMALLTATTLIVLGVGIVLATREVGRIGSWIEMPWLASSVGVGAAGLGLLVTRALGGQAPGLPLGLVEALDAGAILFAVLLAGTVAQARHMRLITLQLAAANRRQADQSAEIANSAQRLQVLIDNVQTAVVVHAADSSIEFANPTASAVLGLSREQMLGRRAVDPAWHFVREDGSPMPVDEFPVSRVIREQQPLRDYIVGVHVSESEPIRWVLVDAVPAFGQDGSLRQVIVSFKDISDRQQQKLELEQLASTDTLTGLATRRRLQETAGNELARARRSGGSLSLVMVDIDHFKSINDRFGHETGDRVLAGVAGLLRKELRSVDLAARWGGEEFCLLLPDTNLQAALEVAERLRAAVEKTPANAPDGSAIQVTASFGVATSRNLEADFHQLVDAADQAMYRAKREGRNRVRPATGGPGVPESAQAPLLE